MGILDKFRKRESREDSPTEFQSIAASNSSSHKYAYAKRLAIVESCISLISNCFRQATITPETLEISSDLLGNLVHTMLSRGESLALIEIVDNAIQLQQVSSWTAHGETLDPNRWRYQCELAYPTGGKAVRTTGDGVVHLRYHSKPEAPYQGLGPLYLAQHSVGMLYSLDSRFDEETNLTNGQIISITMDSAEINSQDDFDQHYGFLTKMRGGTFIESQNRERGSKQSFAGRIRIGAEYHQNMLQLRSQLHNDIAAAFGVPIELIIADGEGTATREAFRRFVLTTVQPLATKIEQELTMKLDTPIELSFEALRSADLQGIGRGIKSLVDSGMSLEKALEQVGL